MARFRRHPFNAREWIVIDIPAGTKAGDTISVNRKDGTIASVLVASVADLGGSLVATIVRQPKR